jgi:hypothetical protein
MILTMKEIQKQLEHAINRTPSGVKRNHICDANISLGAAIRLDEQTDGGVPVPAEPDNQLTMEERAEILLCVRRDAADQRCGARHPLTLAALRTRMLANADRLDRLANKLENSNA